MPANAFLTSDSRGFREDLVDMIWNTSPSDTPLLSSIEKVTATAVSHDWQTDTLVAPAANAVAEGADATYTAISPTIRLANHTQISRKTFSVSDTMEKIKTAGRSSDITYNTIKQGKELRKDMELACIENPIFVTGATRQTRGLRGWIASNQVTNGGTIPIFTAGTGGNNLAIVDGTGRAFTEALLRTAVLAAYNNGGNVDMLMVAPLMKQVISTTFTGGGVVGSTHKTTFMKAENKKLQASYDVYCSDFGDFDIVPNRVMGRTREAYILDSSLLAVAQLRDMQTTELARIGSAKNMMIEAEYTLEVREQRGLAIIRDLV